MSPVREFGLIERAEISYLAVEHAAFLVHLPFVVVIDPKPLEKDLVFV
jgi:hypothetical protein